MKLEFLFVGKTSEKYLEEGIQIYLKRLKHYASVTISVVASLSTGNKDAVIKKESELILKKIGDRDFVVLLDEGGKEFSSVHFADFIAKSMVGGNSRFFFIVGGAYGVSGDVVERSNLRLSFSKFTLTHQMIRIFLLEQVYRAMTILKKEPYHHA